MTQIGKLIGSGHCANVYEYNHKYVVKLFHKHVDQANVDYEYQVSNELHQLGIKTPAAYNLIQVGAQKGIVFKKINGQTLTDKLIASPLKLRSYVKNSASLFSRVHKIRTRNLIPFKAQLSEKISQANSLSGDEKNAINKYLFNLENDYHLCHGDFHFGNIMVEDDDLYIIDWGGVSRGPKVADLTLAIIQFQATSMEGDNIPLYLKAAISTLKPLIINLFIKSYCESNPDLNINEVKESIQRWRLPIAAARLTSSNLDENKILLSIIQKDMQMTHFL